tara:strand:- start:429 stop:593 length:165 start_codon:yes stop_codon:yes gene_type:complete
MEIIHLFLPHKVMMVVLVGEVDQIQVLLQEVVALEEQVDLLLLNLLNQKVVMVE